MRTIALTIGPLKADGFVVQRSGVRWLRVNGQYCRPGELIAYCRIGLARVGALNVGTIAPPFTDEERDFYVGFATKIGGRLFHSDDSSLGGFLDIHKDYQVWTPDFVIGQIEPEPKNIEPSSDPNVLRLFLFGGRRFTPLAETGAELMCGWYNRSRAWSGEGLQRCGTLLSLGICEQAGVVRGEQSAFLEFLEAVNGPAHIVYFPDHLLVPTACMLLEQMKRNEAHVDKITADIIRSWHIQNTVPTPDDLLFAGTLLSSLRQTSLGDGYNLLTRSGLSHGPPDAVLLSLNSEGPFIRRHKRLGYSLTVHSYRAYEAGPLVQNWLRTAFERVKRTPEIIQQELRELIQTVRRSQSTEFLIMNGMSTSGHEDVFNYSSFDPPLGDTLKTYAIKELNLMLQDLAHECDISIVDVDAIAADLGGEAHLPDGLHQSGTLQAEIRREIINILAARGIPGFSPVSVK